MEVQLFKFEGTELHCTATHTTSGNGGVDQPERKVLPSLSLAIDSQQQQQKRPLAPASASSSSPLWPLCLYRLSWLIAGAARGVQHRGDTIMTPWSFSSPFRHTKVLHCLSGINYNASCYRLRARAKLSFTSTTLLQTHHTKYGWLRVQE